MTTIYDLSPEQLELCQKRLQDLRQELLERLVHLQNDLQDVSTFPSDEVDQTSLMISEHQILTAHHRTRLMLLEVESALSRIERGEYGVCEETGEPIEFERLQLMPYTRLSAEGAEIRDTQQKRIG